MPDTNSTEWLREKTQRKTKVQQTALLKSMALQHELVNAPQKNNVQCHHQFVMENDFISISSLVCNTLSFRLAPYCVNYEHCEHDMCSNANSDGKFVEFEQWRRRRRYTFCIYNGLPYRASSIRWRLAVNISKKQDVHWKEMNNIWSGFRDRTLVVQYGCHVHWHSLRQIIRIIIKLLQWTWDISISHYLFLQRFCSEPQQREKSQRQYPNEQSQISLHQVDERLICNFYQYRRSGSTGKVSIVCDETDGKSLRSRRRGD